MLYRTFRRAFRTPPQNTSARTRRRARALALLSAIYLPFAAPSASANVDQSRVWCEPSNPITYCINAEAMPWAGTIRAAAKEWSDKSPWKFEEKANCNDARLVVILRPFDVMDLLIERGGDTLGYFNPKKNASENVSSENVFDLLKPCLLTAEIVIFSDSDWQANDALNCALHEFGHALGLRHSDNMADIMFKANTKAQQLTQHDKDEANDSFRLPNLAQFHQRLTPSGGQLAFSGITLGVPGDALTGPAVVGIRPLSGSSLPRPSRLPEGFDRIVLAAQIGPEWEKGEAEEGAPYILKTVPLRGLVSVGFQVTERDLDSLDAMPGQYASDHVTASLERASLTVALLDPQTQVWTPLPSSASGTGPLNISASATRFGYFAVIGKETQVPVRSVPGNLRIALIALVFLLVIAALYFLLRRRRRAVP